MFAETRGAIGEVQMFLVDGSRQCFDVGIFHSPSVGVMADNHFILDAGASEAVASEKWFPNHGECSESQGRPSHAHGECSESQGRRTFQVRKWKRRAAH